MALATRETTIFSSRTLMRAACESGASHYVLLMQNARRAIRIRSLASELADSLHLIIEEPGLKYIKVRKECCFATF